MRPSKIFFILVLVLSLVWLASFSFVWAEQATNTTQEIEVLNQEIAARKDKIKQLEETIENYKKNIAQKQTEAISLKNQLSILDNNINKVQADIDLTKEKIKQTELEIEALSISIEEKEKIIAKQKQIIIKIVRSIHATDQKNYLEIMASYDNFGDFYTELKNLEDVYVDVGRSVKMIRVAKEELQSRKVSVERKRTSLGALQKQLENNRGEFSDQVRFKEKILTDTKLSEQRYQTLLSSLKKQYQVIEGEVRTFEERVRKKLEEDEKIKSSGDVLMSWPAPSRYLTALFHDPEYPFRRVFEHSGIDIRAAQGTPITAAASGYVARARRCSSASCYSYVLIVHTGNLSTLYGHLSSIAVADDAFVNRGDVIGYSGGTPGTIGAGPFVTGAHLHFEVRKNGIPVDPIGYLVQ